MTLQGPAPADNSNPAHTLLQPAIEASTPRVERLDSIRFLAAVWVTLGHGALPLKDLSAEPTMRLILAAIQASFVGVAAVMVFFIVSGLCIHLPFSGKNAVPAGPFLTRRYIRVGVPLLAVSAIAYLIGPRSVEFLKGVTWSVYAELFYYSLYPFILPLARRFGWQGLIIGTSIPAIVITMLNFEVTRCINLGVLAWFWGLPIWLSGCHIADCIVQGRMPQIPFPVWAWRAVMWTASVLCIYLVSRASTKVGYPTSMLPFSALAYFWLLKELQSPRPLWHRLEQLGAASFSLYLIHPVVLGGLATHVSKTSPAIDILVHAGSLTFATWIMYRLIEAPSHRLARNLANLQIRRNKAAAISA